MSTYEEFSLIVSVALLIVAILNFTHKKLPSYPEKVIGYFCCLILFSTEWVKCTHLPAVLLSIVYANCCNVSILQFQQILKRLLIDVLLYLPSFCINAFFSDVMVLILIFWFCFIRNTIKLFLVFLFLFTFHSITP